MTTVNAKFQTGHVGLNVSDLARSSQFYQDVFGFQVMKQSETPEHKFAFLSEGSTLVLTLWEQSTGAFPTEQPGLHHLSFIVDSIEDVRAAEKRVRASGARFFYDGIVPHAEGAQSGGIFFADPDGIRLEIFTPSGADEQAAPHSDGTPTCGFF